MAGHPLSYDPTPTVNPAGAPQGDEERISASPDLFGAQKGRAEETLGQGIEKASEVGFQSADLQAQIDARTHAAELHTWQSDQMTDAQSEFLQLKGKAALDALPDFKAKINDIAQQARNQAGNPYTTRLVDDEGRRMVDYTYSGASRHAAQQNSVWQSNTARDASASYGSQAVFAASQSPAPAISDDLVVQKRLFDSDQEMRNHASMEGYDGPALDQEVSKNRGANVENIVKQIASDDSPTGLKRAFDFYKSQEDKIDAGSRVKIQTYLKGPLEKVAGHEIFREYSGLPPQNIPPQSVADIPANFVGAIRTTEGFARKAAWDNKQYTNGFGTKAQSPDEVIDAQTANARFNTAISKAAKFVDSVNPNLDPGSRAALTSLTFNTGEGWANAGLGQKFKAGDLAGAKESFLQYNQSGGQINPGLVTRRAREASWFGRGDLSETEASQPTQNHGDVMLRILNDPELQNRPGVQAAALQETSKYYTAWHLQQTQDGAAFKLRLQNSTAEAINTGAVQQPIGHEEFLNAMGPDAGEKAYQDYQTNIKFGADLRSTASLDPQGLNDLEKKYTPQPGDNFIDQSKRYADLQRAISENEQQKKKDPAQFVISSTDAGRQAYQQFQTLMADKNSSPEMKRAYASMFADKIVAEQTRLGVDPGDVRVLPQWYIDSIQKQLATPDANGGAAQIQATIKQQSDLWGDHWPDVYRQIAKGAAPLVRVVGAGIKPEAATALINNQSLKEADLLKNEDDVAETQKSLNKAVGGELKPFARSLSGSQAGETLNDYQTMGTRLATIYLSQSPGDAKAASKKAVNDLLGYKYEFADIYRIPNDQRLDVDAIKSGAIVARSRLGTEIPLASKRDDIGGLSEQYLAENTADALRRNGVWLTSPDEKGLVLMQSNGMAARGPDGKPVIVNWQQLQTMGANYKAGMRAGVIENRAFINP